MLSAKNKQFSELIWNFYKKNKRSFSWREDITPYKILVSEIMLQQTQTSRISNKFPQFLDTFPDLEALANSSLEQVLIEWQGLGYNRRAKYLHLTAKIIVNEFSSIVPKDQMVLQKLPGIGPNTAGSIAAFAYNFPTIFIETNIRSVYIHHYFIDEKEISDNQLIPLIRQTLDKKNPREWYWALMDYGNYLKTQVSNPSKRSKHYTKQSKFDGSNRQVRSKIISLLLIHKKLFLNEISKYFDAKEMRIESNILSLQNEGFLSIDADNNLIKILK